ATQAGLRRRLAHDRPERLPRERSTARIHEQPTAVALAGVEWPRLAEITRDPLRRFGPEGHQALLATLAGAADVARGEVDVLAGEAQALGGPHAGRVEELEHRAIPHAARRSQIGRLDERRRVLPRERARERGRPARDFQMLGGIAPELALADQVPEQSPERRDTSRHAGGAKAARAQTLKVSDEIVRAGPMDRAPLVVQELREVGEIATVGGESIPGRPPLRLESPEILNHHIGHRVTTSDSITTLMNREAAARSGALGDGAPAPSDHVREHRALGHAQQHAAE